MTQQAVGYGTSTSRPTAPIHCPLAPTMATTKPPWASQTGDRFLRILRNEPATERWRRSEEFEGRAAADDPAGFVPHGRPPRGRAQVYSVRIPPDALAALRRLAEARGQLPSVLIRGWVLERLRQETTGEELLVSREELARIVREQVEAALRKAS